MLNQFSRTQLLLGKEGMDALAGAKVAIFGIGGVGGYVVDALARSERPNSGNQSRCEGRDAPVLLFA